MMKNKNFVSSDYISSRQAAGLWGLSSRRVTMLAAQGLIKGAVLMDNRWLIPTAAVRPPDRRREGVGDTASPTERYIYPFLLGCVRSEAQVKQFTEDEQALYRLCLIYETGDFQAAREAAEALLHVQNRCIRLGALYHLPSICMYLSDFRGADRYSALFQTLLRDTDTHRAELNTLLQAFCSEMESATGFADFFILPELSEVSDDLLPLLASHKLFAELMRACAGGVLPDISCYELLCRSAEAQGYFFPAMLMRIYLSLCCSVLRKPEAEFRHMVQAVRLGLEHGTVFTLSYLSSFNADTTERVLRAYPPELTERFKTLAAVFLNSRKAYAEYLGKTAISEPLTEIDCLLLSGCLRGFSNDQLAAAVGLSVSGANKRLSALYRRLGVKSKNELRELYINDVLDWNSK